MRIHIPTIAPEIAAQKAASIFAKGGEWIANAVGSEGFVLARLGTLDGASMKRSGSDTLVGPYNASVAVGRIIIDFAIAAWEYEEKHGDDDAYQSVTVRLIMALRDHGPMTSIDLAKELRLRKNTVHVTIKKLREQGCVFPDSPNPGSKYRLAA